MVTVWVAIMFTIFIMYLHVTLISLTSNECGIRDFNKGFVELVFISSCNSIKEVNMPVERFKSRRQRNLDSRARE